MNRRVRLQVVSRSGTAVDDPGMQRIAGGEATFPAGAHRFPIAHADLAELATRANADGAAVLLRPGHPVGRAIIDRDVIELRRWLVEPGAPRHRARIIGRCIARDDCALVAGDDHRVRVVGRHPGLVVVVSTGRPAQRHPCLAAVLRTTHGDVRDVHDVRIPWIDRDLLEVPAAAPEGRIRREARPRRTGVVRAEEPALSWRWRGRSTRNRRRGRGRGGIRHETVHHRIESLRVRRRDRDARAPNPCRGQSCRELRPGRATVDRLEDAATGPVGWGIGEPGWTTRIP